MGVSFLILAAGTIMGTSPADDDSLDGAIAAKAALSGATKDLYGVLHIPFLTIWFSISTYAGPFARNPLAKHFLYTSM